MRLFVAVDVGDEIKSAIETGVVDVLRPKLPGARWSRPEGRHLTLAFLGETDDERVPAITGALREAAAGHVRFVAAFDEVGAFPNLRRPRVLWTGIGRGADELSALAASVERALEPLGFAGEARPFRAHLTLARFPKPAVIAELPDVRMSDAAFDVGEIALFRSQLHPKGARYTALERFPLSS